MDKKMNLKLNGGRKVTGILRGFDPFMNVVVDDTVEECKDGSRNNIGMVVGIRNDKPVGISAIYGLIYDLIHVLGDPWQQHNHG